MPTTHNRLTGKQTQCGVNTSMSQAQVWAGGHKIVENASVDDLHCDNCEDLCLGIFLAVVQINYVGGKEKNR